MKHAVLFVDDDVNVLHGLTRVLRGQPYQILTATSAEEAMWTLKTRPIDLVVTDEQMPGISGSEFLTWVAEHYPEVIRIVLTGHATVPATIRAINDAKVYRYFTKPCREVDLAMAIRQGLEEKAALRQTQQTGVRCSAGTFPRAGWHSTGRASRIMNTLSCVSATIRRPLISWRAWYAPSRVTEMAANTLWAASSWAECPFKHSRRRVEHEEPIRRIAVRGTEPRALGDFAVPGGTILGPTKCVQIV
jgi:DNA-binding NarL/FixJ family response regulator